MSMQRSRVDQIPAPAPTVKKELITDANGSLPLEKTETPEN
jgi:hypothetical protein